MIASGGFVRLTAQARNCLRPLRPFAADKHVLWLPGAGIAYVRIPKAANSSVRFALAVLLRLDRVAGLLPNKDRFWAAQPTDLAQCLTPAQFMRRKRGAWCFSFVRHPAARLYSCWNNKLVENDQLTPGLLAMGMHKGMSFEAFVDRACTVPDAKCDVHLRGQAGMLMYQGKLYPDFIGRVEHITQDWALVRATVIMRCGQDPGPLRAHNVRLGTQGDVMAELPLALQMAVRQRYTLDFEMFYPE